MVLSYRFWNILVGGYFLEKVFLIRMPHLSSIWSLDSEDLYILLTNAIIEHRVAYSERNFAKPFLFDVTNLEKQDCSSTESNALNIFLHIKKIVKEV